MDTRTYPKNLNVRIESTEDMKRKLETIRRHWRLRSQSEAARYAIDTMYHVAMSAEASPLAAGGHVPALTSE